MKLKLLKRIIFILKYEKLVFGTNWSNSRSGNAPWEGRWSVFWEAHLFLFCYVRQFFLFFGLLHAKLDIHVEDPVLRDKKYLKYLLFVFVFLKSQKLKG